MATATAAAMPGPIMRHIGSRSLSVRARIASAIDQEILPGDEAGVDGTQESKIRAELGGLAVAPGRICGRAVAPDLVERFSGRCQHAAHVLALRVAVEDARQQVVDGDVAPDGLAGEAGDKADEAGASAIREA